MAWFEGLGAITCPVFLAAGELWGRASLNNGAESVRCFDQGVDNPGLAD